MLDWSDRKTKWNLSFVVAAANHAQRRVDEEENGNINFITPDRSRVAQRAARRQNQAAAEPVPTALSQIEEDD